jgi:LysM repeat protein
VKFYQKQSTQKQYKITVAELDAANPILEREALKIGQKIIIPVKKKIMYPLLFKKMKGSHAKGNE